MDPHQAVVTISLESCFASTFTPINTYHALDHPPQPMVTSKANGS